MHFGIPPTAAIAGAGEGEEGGGRGGEGGDGGERERKKEEKQEEMQQEKQDGAEKQVEEVEHKEKQGKEEEQENLDALPSSDSRPRPRPPKVDASEKEELLLHRKDIDASEGEMQWMCRQYCSNIYAFVNFPCTYHFWGSCKKIFKVALYLRVILSRLPGWRQGLAGLGGSW